MPSVTSSPGSENGNNFAGVSAAATLTSRSGAEQRVNATRADRVVLHIDGVVLSPIDRQMDQDGVRNSLV